MSENSELMKVVEEMRAELDDNCVHVGPIDVANWANRLEAIAKAQGEQPDLTAITVRLCAPTDSEPFRQLDCRVVDIGYADRALVVECEEAIRYPAADVLVEALRIIASFKPKGPYDGDGYREWNRAGEYAAMIASRSLAAYEKERTK